MVACRYKVLAHQYKAMYPTLEIDIEGELLRLKVTYNVYFFKSYILYIRCKPQWASPSMTGQ